MSNMKLKINNISISTPIIDILKVLRDTLNNGKLSTIKIMGDNIRVTCPFHKGGHEARASSDIYIGNEIDKLEYGWFKCFTCETSAPFYHFVAGCFESSDEYAKKWLIDNFADYDIASNVIDLPKIQLKNSTVKNNVIDENILASFESFHPYMIQRKISKNIIDLFELKYDPISRSIVFPVRDELSRLVMLTRRHIYNKMFFIEENKEKPLYLLYYIIKNNIKSFMITEGQIDALTAFSYGFPCVATMGAISEHQINLINKLDIRTLYVMFDNDAAGNRFKNTLLKSIKKDILIIPVDIKIDNKKDINDLSKDEFYKCIYDANQLAKINKIYK